MTRTHTPGPWIVTRDQDAIDKALSEGRTPHPLHDHRYIESASTGDLVCSLRDQIPQAADANLIAAAPDLLETLQHLLGRMTNEGVFKSEIKTVRAAIAKAEGGEK